MHLRTIAMVSLFTIAAGCTNSRQAVVGNDTMHPSTQPSGVSIRAADFETLWSAADDTSRELLFAPARQDRRAGLYRTEPMVSGQWFEPWRTEVRTASDRVQSSLATIRRTLSVQVTKDDTGGFVATPSVLVERFVLAERRVSTSAGYRSIYRDARRGTYGTAETDQGIELPDSYWYPVGNDPVLERYVARQIEKRIGQ